MSRPIEIMRGKELARFKDRSGFAAVIMSGAVQIDGRVTEKPRGRGDRQGTEFIIAPNGTAVLSGWWSDQPEPEWAIPGWLWRLLPLRARAMMEARQQGTAYEPLYVQFAELENFPLLDQISLPDGAARTTDDNPYIEEVAILAMSECLQNTAQALKEQGLGEHEAVEYMALALIAAWYGRPLPAHLDMMEGVAYNLRRLGIRLDDAVSRSRSAFSAGWKEGFFQVETNVTDSPKVNAVGDGTTQQRDPDTYFTVQANGPWVQIKSLGVAGGKGEVSLHESHVGEFFHCARTGSISDYESWAFDPYPVGGSTMLMRMCSLYDDYKDRSSPAPADEEGILFIDPDTHPSDGRLYFGDRTQELEQLRALCRLEDSIVALLAAAKPRQADKQAAAERAARIAKLAGISFMPSDGFCSFCDADVTHALAGIAPGASITGCPVCGHTWCD